MDQENQTTVTPPPQTSQPVDSQNPIPKTAGKRLSTLHILAGVGIGLILLASGFLLYNYLYSGKTCCAPPSYTKKATSSAKTATTSAQKDETADWKTYASSKSGFSLKHPLDWLEKACTDGDVLFLAPTKETLGACQSEFGGLINISYIADFKYVDYIAQQPFVDLSSLNNGKREETTVAGSQAIKISGTYKEDSFTLKKDAQKILYLVDYKGGVLSLNFYDEPVWGDYSQTFEKIVSTFKFN